MIEPKCLLDRASERFEQLVRMASSSNSLRWRAKLIVPSGGSMWRPTTSSRTAGGLLQNLANSGAFGFAHDQDFGVLVGGVRFHYNFEILHRPFNNENDY